MQHQFHPKARNLGKRRSDSPKVCLLPKSGGVSDPQPSVQTGCRDEPSAADDRISGLFHPN